MSRVGPERSAERYRKAAEAAALRRAGERWDDIADKVGYANRGAAFTAVKGLMKENQALAYHEITLYREESLERLADLLKAVWPMAMKASEKHVTQARLIISQMDDLTGAKAPLRYEIGGSDVDRLLRDALDEFERRAADLDRQATGLQADQARDS